MTAHSQIGASSMYRWAACPASVRLSTGLHKASSFAAAEGSVAHDIASTQLETNNDPTDLIGTTRVYDGHKILIDEEMIEGIAVYTEAVRALKGERLIEHKFDMSKVYPGLFGTCDAITYDADTQTLYVDDFKYGKGIPVEVVEYDPDGKPTPNVQLMYYAMGAVSTSKWKPTTVVMRIIQPRCPHKDGPVRSWSIDALELMEFSGDLIKYARETENPNAQFKSGDHCRFCPAAAICPELKNKAQKMAKTEFAPERYDAAELAKVLTDLDVIEGWAKSVREFCYSEAEQGRPLPGFKLVEKKTNRAWKDEAATTVALRAAGLGETQMYKEPVLQSPSGIEKVLTGLKIKPKERAAIVGPLVHNPVGGHVLVTIDDPREPVKKDAKSEFAPA